MSLRALIVDDEPIARRRIARLVRAEPDIEIVGECGSGKEAVAALRAQPVDLLFLDVQMPDCDGFGVLAAVGAERLPTVVFITAYDEYAIRAFEVHAVDYVLKPVQADRFHAAVAHARDQIAQATTAQSGRRLRALLEQALADREPALPPVGDDPPGSRHLERITVRRDGKVVFVKTTDVDWFGAEGNYVRLHVGKVTHVIRQTMQALERQLPRRRFARIHRATIVNLDSVRELQPWFAGDSLVILRDGTQLKVTRTYRAALEARLSQLP